MPNIAKAISSFSMPIAVLSAIVVFFVFYNTFLVDNTIESLRFSLEQTAQAYDITDLEGVDLLLNQIMIEEITPEKINLLDVANIEYARNTISGSKSYKSIDSVKTSLATVIKSKEEKRGALLSFLGNANRAAKRFVSIIYDMTDRYFKRDKGEAKSVKEDVRLFDKAKALEKGNKPEEALIVYNEFISKHPSYQSVGMVKVRTANIYFRLGQYKKSIFIYRGVIKRYVGKKESFIAQMLLFKLQQIEKLQAKANMLLAKVSDADAAAKQQIFYQLGVVNLHLFNIDESKKYFKRAADADPGSELAAKAKFNSAWASKEQGRMEESVREFSSLVDQDPNSIIALDSRYQTADICRKEGKYEESIRLYIKLAEEYKGDPIGALCLFQAATSCMYDLNDEDRAKAFFAQLSKQYPDSPYAKYVAPGNPIGVFVTYLVPRATRVVAWRFGGLLALAGYSGKIVKFTERFGQNNYSREINSWLRSELPDTIGNLYVDIKGAELNFEKDKISGSARIMMGKFSVFGEAEGRVEPSKEGSVNIIITKARLEKIPIPPVLINASLTGITLIVGKHFPILVTNAYMNNGELIVEGYGSDRMIKAMKGKTRNLMGEISYKDIVDYKERKEIYDSFLKKFPESDFSNYYKTDPESTFLDFLTRMYLYTTFKLLETTKDTKLDYERSVRSLGRLMIKKGRFGISYRDAEINKALNELIRTQFPLVFDDEFMFDVKGLQVRFMSDGGIRIQADIGMDRIKSFAAVSKISMIRLECKAMLEIDKDSKLPIFLFKDILLNGKSAPVEKFNMVMRRGLNILKDARLPFETDDIQVSSGSIKIKGSGARDLTARIFSDPDLFVIFQIREIDLAVAGIKKLKDYKGDFRAQGYDRDYDPNRAIGYSPITNN